MAQPATVSFDGDLAVLHHRCAALHDLIAQPLPPSKISASCQQTLLRLVAAELRFLSRLSSPPHQPRPLSSNLGYLESLTRVALHPAVSGISRLSKPLASSPAPVHVDLVCTVRRNPAWVLVSGRNPLHLDGGLRLKVERVVLAARSACALKPASVFLVFSQGIRAEITRNLEEEFAAVEIELFEEEDGHLFEELEEGWVCVMRCRKDRVFEIRIDLEHGDGPRVLEELEDGDEVCTSDEFGSVISSMRPRGGPEVDVDAVNFDTTALVAIVSGISNGDGERLLKVPEDELRTRFKNNYEFVIAQVMSELQHPILAEMRAAVAGKTGIICKSVHSEFKELISMCGGPSEKLRAEQLVKHLLIVLDSPSARIMDLPTTRKIALKNKVVFGTGDYWHAPTLTANSGFVRAISQIGMSLLTIEHRPCALTGY